MDIDYTKYPQPAMIRRTHDELLLIFEKSPEAAAVIIADARNGLKMLARLLDSAYLASFPKHTLENENNE
jgi:hypothetical protein